MQEVICGTLTQRCWINYWQIFKTKTLICILDNFTYQPACQCSWWDTGWTETFRPTPVVFEQCFCIVWRKKENKKKSPAMFSSSSRPEVKKAMRDFYTWKSLESYADLAAVVAKMENVRKRLRKVIGTTLHWMGQI